MIIFFILYRSDYLLYFTYSANTNVLEFKNKFSLKNKRIIEFKRLNEQNYLFVLNENSDDFLDIRKLKNNEVII